MILKSILSEYPTLGATIVLTVYICAFRLHARVHMFLCRPEKALLLLLLLLLLDMLLLIVFRHVFVQARKSTHIRMMCQG